MKSTLVLVFLLLLSSFPPVWGQEKPTFFELKVYHFQTPQQEALLEAYFKDAYLPALRRQGIKSVGVFKLLGNDTLQNKRIYLLIPHRSLAAFAQLPGRLQKDKQHQQAGTAYLEAPAHQAPYSRIETILLESFAGMPGLKVPKLETEKKEWIYELRSYESPTEKLFQNKVHMFNEGDEIGIFERLGFNAVFYGSVLSGSRMPNLMYLTTHQNMEQRNKNWKAFGADPAWKKLSSSEQYDKNNVSKIDVYYLQATEYSGI